VPLPLTAKLCGGNLGERILAQHFKRFILSALGLIKQSSSMLTENKLLTATNIWYDEPDIFAIDVLITKKTFQILRSVASAKKI
jgi:hypothetical protein